MQSLRDYKSLAVQDLISNDVGLKKNLSYILGVQKSDQVLGVLKSWEEKLPKWDELAIEAARPEKLPRFKKYDHVGNAVEKIILPLETQTIRREVVESGIFCNESEVEKFAKIYLLAHLGESGITCPLACTDGLIRVLDALGSEFLKKKYLPLLKSKDNPLAGAQFITEQAGGSDIGAIEGVARKTADGHFLLAAEKWYCSATDEFFLVAARPEGAPQGTSGIAIFFVPRTIEVDGKILPNKISIRRLKNKLGTQSLPTAEIDFQDSIAYLIGSAEQGFHHLMNYVLNCSRIHNAANSLGIIHRAFAEARHYAEQRVAFGKTIIHYPLVQQHLLDVLTYLNSRRALFFHTLKEIDTHGFLPENKEQRLWQRCLINLIKYRTASQQTEKVKEAILVFGANGIIEDFSILPRLLRDSLIVETWEGTHNVLCLQIMRDSTRFAFWERVQTTFSGFLKKWPDEVLPQSRKIYVDAVKHTQVLLSSEHLRNKQWVHTHARRLIDHIANLLEIGLLFEQAQKLNDHALFLQISFLCHQFFTNRFEQLENPVLNSLEKFGLNLIREEKVETELLGF